MRARLPGMIGAAILALVVFVPGGGARAAGAEVERMFGINYVAAETYAVRLGLVPKWIVRGKTLRLESQWTRIDLTVHSVDFTLNGLRLFLSEPVALQRGKLFLSERDIQNVIRPILVPRPAAALRPPKTIVLDPGHGGVDPGNENRRLKLSEKNYTLDVARRLERILKQQGYRVVMTRTRDRTLGLDERAAVANKARADLFISIHFNSFTAGSVAGTETFVMPPVHQQSSPQPESTRNMAATKYPGNRHDRWNVVLGYQMHRQLLEKLQSVDRGLKHFRYSVLRNVECPAVLVEAAFLSNEVEGRKVATAAYRQRIADGIAAGVKAYAAEVARAGKADGA